MCYRHTMSLASGDDMEAVAQRLDEGSAAW